MSDPRAPDCPDGRAYSVLDSRLAGEMPGEAPAPFEPHLDLCRACARVYVQASAFLALERRWRGAGSVTESAGGAGASAPPPPILPLPVRRPLLRPRTWVAAAAALLVAAGIGVAAVLLLREPQFVGSSPGGLGRAGEIGLRSRLDFASADIGPQSEVRGWVSFVLPGGAVGSGALVKRDDGHLDFAAFGPEGAPLWVASRDWADWADTLDGSAVYTSGVRSLVVRRDGNRLTESLVFLLLRNTRSAILIVDPVTGRRQATVFHDGVLADQVAGAVEVALLPGADGSGRSLLFAGQYRSGDDIASCVLVLAPDGRILQHLRLPSIDLVPPPFLWTREVRVDWSPDRPEVSLETSDHLLFSFLVKDGRLDSAGVRMLVPDHLQTRYDEKFGEGAFQARVQAAGGREAFARALAAQVRGLTLEAPRPWRSR